MHMLSEQIPQDPVASPPDSQGDNPFAPPRPEPGSAPTPGPGRNPDIAAVAALSWSIFRQRPLHVIGMVMGFFGVTFAIQLLLDRLPRAIQLVGNDPAIVQFLEFAASIAAIVLSTWISVGLQLALLRIVRGRQTAFADLFRGGPYLVTAILGSIVIAFLVMLPSQAIANAFLSLTVWPISLASFFSRLAVAMLGVVAIAIVLLRLNFFVFAAIEYEVGVRDALIASWTITRSRLPTLVLMLMTQVCLVLAGALALGIGLVVALPFAFLLHAATYVLLVDAYHQSSESITGE